MEKWQYYGLFLDKENHDKLIDVLVDYHWIGTLNDSEKKYLDHCTLMHNSQKEYWLEILLNDYLCNKFHITILAVGISDKTMAFKVKRHGIVVSCKNTIPHITICTFNDGKPVDSNNITKWYDLDEPIEIETTLKRV